MVAPAVVSRERYGLFQDGRLFHNADKTIAALRKSFNVARFFGGVPKSAADAVD
jgi:hypothetical protein